MYFLLHSPPKLCCQLYNNSIYNIYPIIKDIFYMTTFQFGLKCLFEQDLTILGCSNKIALKHIGCWFKKTTLNYELLVFNNTNKKIPSQRIFE